MSWWQNDPPDGPLDVAKATAGAGWWQNDPEDDSPRNYGIDFSQPVVAVRGHIARLPQEDQEDALRQWSDARVANERKGGGVVRGIGEGLRSVARGASFGLDDEMGASIQGGLHAVSGGALGAPYNETLEYERAYNRATDRDQGLVGTGLQIAGGLPLAAVLPAAGGITALGRVGAGARTGAGYGAVSGFGSGEDGLVNRLESGAQGAAAGAILGGGLTAGINGARAVRRAYANQGEAGAYGAIADDLPNGVDQFADEVATGALRANITTNRRTLDVLGEEMQRAGGDVAQAQQATIARIVQEQGVTPQTAAGQIRRLTAVHEDSPLMLAEQPAVSGSDAAQRLRQPQNINLDELGRTQASTTQASLDYLGNNGNAQSAQNVRNAVSARQETLGPAMRDTLAEIGPRVQTGQRATRPATIVDTNDMIAGARQVGGQEYRAAYAGPIDQRLSIYALPRMLQHYENQAAGRSGEYADVMRRAADQFYIQTPNGQRLAMNTLQQLQDARGALRGQMTGYAAQGRNDLARVVRPMYQRVTRLMEAMSPQWGVANRRWADMNFDEVAQELGDAFATKAGPQFREQVAQFQGMAPQAQNIVRVHVLQKLSDKLDNLGDTHSVSKLFSSDQARTLIRTIFGDDAVVGFTRAVRDQRVAEQSGAMMRNSATHRRGVAQKQKDAETGLVSAVENANARGVKNWLLERATQALTERRNRPMADILTTPMSDTANVARHIHNMRAQQQRLQQFDAPTNTQSLGLAGVGPLVGNALSPHGEDRQEGKALSQRDPRTGFARPMHLGGPMPEEYMPEIFNDAQATAAWDRSQEPTGFIGNALSRAQAASGKARADSEYIRQNPKQAAKDFATSAISSFIDFGGASSNMLRSYGGTSGEKAASRLEELQGQSGAGSLIGGFNPSAIPGAIYDAGAETYNYLTSKPEPERPAVVSRDEFFGKRRASRETLEQAQARAERDFMASPGYQTMIENKMVTKAKEALRESGERAKSAWQEGQRSKASEETQIGKDYDSYIAEENRHMESENAKGFSERNPWFKPAVAVGALASGGLAARSINKLTKRGEDLIKDVEKAKKAGDAQLMAQSTAALKNWDESLVRKQIAAVTLPATVPLDVRGMADVVDKYGLPSEYYDASGNPQPVLAQQRAAEHLKPMNFLADSLPAILSGLTGAGVGAKMAKSAPRERAQAIISNNSSATTSAADAAVANASDTLRVLQARQLVQQARQDAAAAARNNATRSPQPRPAAEDRQVDQARSSSPRSKKPREPKYTGPTVKRPTVKDRDPPAND
jgi:hypothetical protein